MFYLKGPCSTCYCWWTNSYNQFIYVHVTTLPETNISPQIELPKGKYHSNSNHPFSEAMLVSRRVIVGSNIQKIENHLNQTSNLFMFQVHFPRLYPHEKSPVFLVGISHPFSQTSSLNRRFRPSHWKSSSRVRAPGVQDRALRATQVSLGNGGSWKAMGMCFSKKFPLRIHRNGIFTDIFCWFWMVNVGKYTIHGSYGVGGWKARDVFQKKILYPFLPESKFSGFTGCIYNIRSFPFIFSWPIFHWTIHEGKIVGGWTNPSEKYARQIGFIFPNFWGENSKNVWVATT